MSTPNRILIFIDWFYPAYKAGGPIKSVFNIVESLKSEIYFLIVTSNKDVDGEVLKVKPNHILGRDGFQVVYLDPEHQKKKKYKEIFEGFEPDVLYYNSIFSKNFTLKPLLCFRKLKVKQLIAPRGMLGKGALAIKPLKKKVFLKLFNRMFKKNENLCWHASTELERSEIYTVFGNTAKVQVAQNLSSVCKERKLEPSFKIRGELKLVFISRISVKKNLLFAIDTFQELKTYQKLSLEIYGPIEDDNYWRNCLSIIDSDSRISYKGILKPTEVSLVLHNNHFLILPTQHENYGHAIAEAINAGVPVLISDQTPWRNLKEEGVGFDIAVSNKQEWKRNLEKLVSMKQTDYEEMVAACHRYSLGNIVSKDVLEENRRLFGL